MEWMKIDTTSSAKIYPSGGNTNAPLAVKIIKISVKPSARLTRNVLASGQTIYDSKVVEPVSVVCDVVLERRNAGFEKALKQIHEMWNQKVYSVPSDLSAVLTKEGRLYKNLVLSEFPHTEDAKHVDAFVFQLVFSEYIMIGGSSFSPAKSADAS